MATMLPKFKDAVKVAGMTAGEVAVLGTGMLLTKKFLDFNVLFKKQIEKNPKLADAWYIKHQGIIKIAVGVLAAAYIKNPWLRLLAIGVAAEGFISEVRVISTNKDGVSFFDKIGNKPQTGQAELDAELLRLAQEEIKNASGQENPTEMWPSAVGQQSNPTEMYPTAVGYNMPATQLNMPGTSMVGGPVAVAA